MDIQELIEKTERIEAILPVSEKDWTRYTAHAFFITTIQFIKNYIGIDTEFYATLNSYNSIKTNGHETDKAWAAKKVLKSLKDYLSLNLDIYKSEKYNIKIDIISDFMAQAIDLANNEKFHPAAAAILMGASLEEFLKKIAEKREIDLAGVKMSIDPISKKLYEAKVINKQDSKDIISWAGIRNEATHGNFETVNDRKRIFNAIEGVNLFMRKLNN